MLEWLENFLNQGSLGICLLLLVLLIILLVLSMISHRLQLPPLDGFCLYLMPIICLLSIIRPIEPVNSAVYVCANFFNTYSLR